MTSKKSLVDNMSLSPQTHPAQRTVSYTVLGVVLILTVAINFSRMFQVESDSLLQSTSALFLQQSHHPNINTDDNQPSKASYFGTTKKIYAPIPPRPPGGTQQDLVQAGDFIFYNNNNNQTDSWDAAPIVLEQYKLIFFTIPKCGCTVWKQLFRRIMGYSDWSVQDGETSFLPHNPQFNGLQYLSDYSLSQASEMMTSPDWTRAIMVREPKQRFLSAFLDKAVSNDHRHIYDRCCPEDGGLLPQSMCDNAHGSAEAFLTLVRSCDDDHWRPQHHRLEPKYWPYMDEVLHVESAFADTKALLQRLGAWNDHGATGWGRNGGSSIFASTEVQAAGEHATWANWQHWKWFTPKLEEQVERFYMADYENPLFNFTRGICLTCNTDDEQ